MNTSSYPSPVDKLLTYGDGRDVGRNSKNWFCYLELGIGPEHILDLIRMATDQELYWAESDTLEVWAPIHAWRTLGQLRTEDAIEPLLSQFETPDGKDHDYWAMEELPNVYGMIGPVAIPALAVYLANESHGSWARTTAASCLEKIGTMHPASRDACVSALTKQLEQFEENDSTFNALLISYLIDLDAVEALPAIERAFAADAVDLMVAGDWDDVQFEFGFMPDYEELVPVPQPRIDEERAKQRTLSSPMPQPPMSQRIHHSNHKKAKNKMAKLSRKKNKKRK